MRLYIDPEKIAAKLKEIPIPLRAKALNELDDVYKARGFKSRSSGQDNVGHYVDVDLRPGTDMAKVYEFLNTAYVAAVTIEPDDIEKMWGKNPVSLGLRRSIELNGVKAAGLELVEPDALADALTAARVQSWGNNDGEIDATAHQFATDDLVQAGFLDERETNAVDEWLEAKDQPLGLQAGDPARRYSEDSDMEEYTPEFEVEEEWGSF